MKQFFKQLFIRKNRKEIRLTEFIDAVHKVAESYGESYSWVEIRHNITSSHGSHLELRGYINGSDWVTGLTISDVVEKLHESRGNGKTSKKSPIQEVYF